ncbi:MAG TPA: pilus assembly protein PilM [Gammaproteobacteria bacterium]|nr:pilus assembly protein PilM [Gammaproteobacteria bacterium]
MLRYLNPSRFLRKQPLIGIDIAVDGIKLVQLQKSAGQYHLEKIIHRKVSNQLLIEECLKIIVDDFSLKKYGAIIAVPYQEVVAKQLQLPDHLSLKELKYEIKNRFLSYFAQVPENEWCYDYFITTNVNNANHIHAVAVRNSTFHSKLNLLKVAGLIPKIVDINTYALARAAQLSHDEPVILLDCSSLVFSFIVTHAGKIIFQQSCLLDSSDGCGQTLKSFWQHYTSTFTRKINLVLISGDLVSEAWLQEVHRTLNISTAILNPFKNIVVAKDMATILTKLPLASFALCCGLALRL